MDYQKFLQELPTLYHHWGEDSVIPKSAQFQEVSNILAETPQASVMQLLNFAVSCMAEEEIYCEVGTGQGLTLIGALLNHPDRAAYGVDNLSTEDDLTGENLAQLMENLDQFQLQDQVYFCEQDCQDFFFDLREAGTSDRLGVFFYNGPHDYRSQLMGLMLGREFLADQALIIISQTNWATPKQAIADFLCLNSESELLLELSTPTANHPSFGNGLIILSWDIQKASFILNPRWQENQQKYQQKSVITAIYNLQVLDQQHEESKAIYFKALQLHAQGDLILAEKYYQDFLLWNSDNFEGWYNLGLLYHTGERYQAAIGSFRKAQASNPDFIDVYSSLGHSFTALGEPQQAIDIYHQGISINPDHFGCYLNLGNLLLSQGDLEQAITIYNTGLKFSPHNLDLSNNLQVAEEQYHNSSFLLLSANNLYAQGKYPQALSIYQRLLNLDMADADLYFNLSDIYQNLQNFSESIRILQAGTEQHPQDAKLQFTLIIQLQQQGSTEAAIAQAEIAANLIPENYVFQLLQYLLVPILYDSVEEIDYYKQRFSQGLITLTQTTYLDTPEKIHQAFLGISRVTNFYLAYQAHNVKDLQIQYGQLLEKIMAARYPQWVQPLVMPELALSGEKQKIKVGYVSAYLRSYSGTYWLQGWLKFHNHDHLEIYCYHTGNICDAVTENFRKYSHSFHHIPDNFEAVCQQILEDKLHILIFPEIGMDAPTMARAGLRLAPIQCTAWGHPVTTGLSTIDYFISSELMEGNDAPDHYSETLIQLPNVGVAYPALGDIPQQIKDKSYFSFPKESIIYLCLQAPFKYLPQYDYILPAIAQQVPQAKFIFLRGELLRQRLDRAFAAQGLVYTDFCLFLKIPAREDYLMLNLVADVFLDTCTWSGGNTSLEAIACGLPLVTCPGEFMRGRHADSFLKMIGVTETIAEDIATYIEIAVRLGLDEPWRREIKAKMQQRQSQLFDDRTCVAALENFFDRVVQG